MKPSAWQAALATLEGKEVLVSFSGGKDSKVCLDLACRVASKVAAFAMEIVPGLRCFDEPIERAEARYKLTIRRYPHWVAGIFAREGVYRFHEPTAPLLDINDIYEVARADTGIDLIVTGAKRGDSLWRRRTGAVKFAGDRLKAPLWDWSSRDVMAYLAMRELGAGYSDGRKASGIDLTVESVCNLYDHHPDDYRRLERAYPFCGAIVLRRKLYGIGPGAAKAEESGVH